MNRLSKFDKDLINTETESSCNRAVQNKSYARSCPGPNKPDNQPIAILKKDLDKLDEKTGVKNKGISYKSSLHVEGRNPEIKYICPKFWDVKNEIPLAPDRNKVDKSLSDTEYVKQIKESWIHPITKENFEKDIVSHDLTTEQMKDTDKYILDRSGRPKDKKDKDSTWDRTLIDPKGKRGKYDIDKYNVSMIPNIHPEGYDIPCCGMSPIYKYWHIEDGKKSFKLELLDIIENENGSFYLLHSENTKMMEKELQKNNIEEKFTKNKIILPSFMFNNSPDLNRILYSFPLDNKTKGYLTEDLLNYFSMKEKEPYIVKNNVKDVKLRKAGLYRVGIKQNYNSFLSCITSCIYNYKIGDWINIMIDNIEKDLFALDGDIYLIANGNFTNCFESKDLFNDKYSIVDLFSEKIPIKGYPKFVKDRIINGETELLITNLDNKKKILENRFLLSLFKKYSTIRNFIAYLKSVEYKKEEYIIPVLVQISQLKDNLTFKELKKEEIKKLSIIVFEDKNEKIRLVEPFGRFSKKNVSHYLMIYKCGENYEPIYYYDMNHGHNRMISKEINSVIIDKIEQLIHNDSISESFNQSEYPSRLKLIEMMKTMNRIYKYDSVEYVNDKNHVVYLRYTKNKETKILIPIKPEPIQKTKLVKYESYEENVLLDKIPRVSFKIIYDLLKKIDNYEINKILKDIDSTEKEKIFSILLLNVEKDEKINMIQKVSKNIMIDLLIDQYYKPKYKKYIDNKEKVYVNDKNKCQYLSLSLKVPIYLKRVLFKQKNIKITRINEYQYLSFLNIQYKNKAIIEREKEKKIQKEISDFFSQCYYYLRKNPQFLDRLKSIKNHPIKLSIHKRMNLFNELIQLDFCKDNSIQTKQFVEYFLIYPYEKLEFVILQNYLKIEDFKKINENTLLFSYYQIFNDEHEYYFLNRSAFIPNISYYGEYDENISKKHLYKKNNYNVSFFTKYPNEIKLIYGDVVIYENNSDIENDFATIQLLLKEESIQKIMIRMENMIKEIYQSETKILSQLDEEYYESIRELNDINYLQELSKLDHKISKIDLYILSYLYQCGFTMYSNIDSEDFQINFITNNDSFKKDMIVYNLYMNKDDKKLKIIGDKPQILSDMFQKNRFKKYMKRYHIDYFNILIEN